MIFSWLMASNKKPCPPVSEGGHKAVQRLATPVVHVQAVSKSCPQQVPENAGVSTFVSWMRLVIERSKIHASEGRCRAPLPWEWSFEDLYEQYTEVCKLGRRRPEVEEDEFWDQLKAAGCTRRRGDLRVNGSRSRPYLYRIPSEPQPPALKLVRNANGDQAAYASERKRPRHYLSQGTLGNTATRRIKAGKLGALGNANPMEVHQAA